VNREAADLFERARQARVQSNYQAALQSYRELERRYPTSAESRASRAIVARILLDTGQSEAALVDLDRYLAEGPAALTEEVMVSRGLAYERLGQPAEERKAWQSLLRAYPGSMYGTRARARLRALDAGR
jgi:outer membrane protein assembly factor BamD (BamD/ComL family)